MTPLVPIHPSVRSAPVIEGRYEVVRLLGKGAQARVFLAWDRRVSAWRALKVLAPEAATDAELRRRFELEGRMMARLTHTNLLRVIDLGSDGVTPYMVMEVARGGAVTSWIKRNGPLPPRAALQVSLQACAALHFAHGEGLVHRDVKPHNLLVVAEDRIALTDFGVARQQHNDTGMTQTGTVMGTFAFMAPEQRQDAKSVDLRADVYGLGATLYNLLTGKTSAELFYASDDLSILSKIAAPIRPVIAKACAYERDRRYLDMHAMASALHLALDSLASDPARPAFMDQPIVLPLGPNGSADDDVDELRQVLALDEEHPTYVPSAASRKRAEEEEEQRTVVGAHRRRPRMAGDPTTDEHLSNPSVSTISPPAPAPRGVVPLPPRPKTAPPPEVRTTAPTGAAFPWPRIAAGAVGVVMFVLLSTVGIGIANNFRASAAVTSAEAELADRAAKLEPLLPAIVDAGADRDALLTAYYAWHDNPSPAAAAALADFVKNVDLKSGAPAALGIESLVIARFEWKQADADLDAVKASPLQLFSMGIGL